MSGNIKTKCMYCGKSIEIKIGEYNRQKAVGREHFFCSRSCAAKYGNRIRPDRRVLIKKICPHCNKEFETMSGAKSKTFCSSSCASAGSVTDKRRRRAAEVGNKNLRHDAETISKGLRSRENWKYEEIKEFLSYLGIKGEFEYVVRGSIFDLGIPSKRLLIEFDGGYHSGEQKKKDKEKDKKAERFGWKTVRVKVPDNQVIKPNVLYEVL